MRLPAVGVAAGGASVGLGAERGDGLEAVVFCVKGCVEGCALLGDPGGSGLLRQQRRVSKDFWVREVARHGQLAPNL